MTPARELELLALSAAIVLAGVLLLHKLGQLIDWATDYWYEVSAREVNQRRHGYAEREVLTPETRRLRRGEEDDYNHL